jgi:hypothetical protein
VWASVIESEVERVAAARMRYNMRLREWEKEATAYNKQVADIENLIESLDNQGWVHQIQAGVQGLSDGGEREDGLFNAKVQAMVEELPEECPEKPELPGENIDISLDGAKYVSGFGTLTAGEIELGSTKVGTRKSFGVFGQGRLNEQGFSSKLDATTEAGGAQCRARYLALNLYPLRRTFTQKPGQYLELTASSEKPSTHRMTKPGPPRASQPAACADFTPGAQFFVDTLGAGYLKTAMVASMATLAALTLY